MHIYPFELIVGQFVPNMGIVTDMHPLFESTIVEFDNGPRIELPDQFPVWVIESSLN